MLVRRAAGLEMTLRKHHLQVQLIDLVYLPTYQHHWPALEMPLDGTSATTIAPQTQAQTHTLVSTDYIQEHNIT